MKVHQATGNTGLRFIKEAGADEGAPSSERTLKRLRRLRGRQGNEEYDFFSKIQSMAGLLASAKELAAKNKKYLQKKCCTADIMAVWHFFIS